MAGRPGLLRDALGLGVVCALALQLAFVARIATMAVSLPASTTFQRSEAWRLLREPQPLAWQQQPVPYERISPNLKRAVIASEDAGFLEHGGIEWDAIEKAWERNRRAEAAAERVNERLARRPAAAATQRVPKVVGGSTITQQLAKNLFLSSERHVLRKAQEAVLALALEAILGKRRILELYLNHVEWGRGVFGAEAASRRYFRTGAGSLGATQAAQLAVMLPAPKRFEQRPGSPYVAGRTATIAARLVGVAVP